MSNPKIYPYEELKVTSKARLPSDVDRDHLEVRCLNYSLYRSSYSFLFSVIYLMKNFIFSFN